MSRPAYRKAIQHASKEASAPIHLGSLPDDEKERLCLDLLEEFGAKNIKVSGNGELIHSCLLPFGGHRNGDLHPSASLNYRKLVYNCLGCGNSGGLLWFIGTCRNTTGTEARKWLGKQTGVGGEQSLANLLEFFDEVYGEKKLVTPPMPKMDRRVLDPWMSIHPYLTEVRGIPEQNIMQFNVGWNADLNRIVIPHFWKSDLVGWQTRRLLKDGSPKYLSTPDFPRDRTLFNFQPKRKMAVLVESPMSVISKAHMSDQLVATFGAKITDRQMKLLSLYPELILWFDNDLAGWQATETVGKALESYSRLFVVNSNWGADVADFDDQTFSELMNNLVSFGEWVPPTHLDEWKGGIDAAQEVR